MNKELVLDSAMFIISSTQLITMGVLIFKYILRPIAFAYQYYCMGVFQGKLVVDTVATITIALVLTIVIKKVCDRMFDNLFKQRY